MFGSENSNGAPDGFDVEEANFADGGSDTGRVGFGVGEVGDFADGESEAEDVGAKVSFCVEVDVFAVGTDEGVPVSSGSTSKKTLVTGPT